jgi:hypothetical protein
MPGCGRLRVLTRSNLPFKSTKGDDRKGGIWIALIHVSTMPAAEPLAAGARP